MAFVNSLTSILEVASNPSPESLLQCFRLRVLETRGNFIPRVSLAQQSENFTDILAMILLDPAFDEFDQQLALIHPLVMRRVPRAVSIKVSFQRPKRQGNRVGDASLGATRRQIARFPNRPRPHPARRTGPGILSVPFP